MPFKHIKLYKEVVWRWDWGVYVPFCPYCDEPAYEKDKCLFCGKPYKWVEGEYKDTIIEQGEYTIVQATNNHISIYKNGEFVYHASCTKKLTEQELLKRLEFYLCFTMKDENGKVIYKKFYKDESEEENNESAT